MARRFNNWIQAYLEHTRASESPTSFHFWTAVSTIAGALRRRVWIDQNEFQWTPNFYIVLVGPPGVAAKSTSIRAGMRILEKVPKISFGPESMTWQALTVALQDCADSFKYFDASGREYKKLMSPLTIEVSELGTFIRMEDDAMLSVLIDLWDGRVKPWRHSTKSSGSVIIENPWLNIIGCTTPSWLQQNFPQAMIGGGLTSRVIFVYGGAKRQLVAYPATHIKPADYIIVEEWLAEDLLSISTLAGEYRLSSDALKWGEKWYSKHWTSKPLHLASARYDGYRARKQTHLHKLAMILAASKRSTLTIEVEDLMEADAQLVGVEADMLQVFNSIGTVDEHKHLEEMMALVKTYGFITAEELWQLCRTTFERKTFEATLKLAIESSVLIVTSPNGKRGLSLNPKLKMD
jgi:hypothetical protein